MSRLAHPDHVWLPCTGCDPYACRRGCGRWLLTVDYSIYTVADLGLVPHDRAGCPHCTAGVVS